MNELPIAPLAKETPTDVPAERTIPTSDPQPGITPGNLPSGLPTNEQASKVIRLSDVTPQPTTSLWDGIIAFGELAVLEGDPGHGKSSLATDIMARLTVGREMPTGSSRTSGGAVLLTGEESVSKTLVQRMSAAGADLSRIAVVKDDGFELPRDLNVIEDALDSVAGRMVVIDPLPVFTQHNLNSNQSVRRVMGPLRELAERRNVAIVVVRHLNKSTATSAVYRGLGSIATYAAARSVLLVGKHPDDPRKCVVCQTKNNLGPLAGSIAFMPVPTNGTVSIKWLGRCSVAAEDLLKKPAQRTVVSTGQHDATPISGRWRSVRRSLYRIGRITLALGDIAVSLMEKAINLVQEALVARKPNTKRNKKKVQRKQ